MKLKRSTVIELLDAADIKTSKKGKPLSNAALLEILKDNVDSMMEADGENAALAAISTAFDNEDEVEITGDDPTVPKKAKKPEPKPAKGKGKPAKEEESEDEEESDDDDSEDDDSEEDEEEAKPAKGKKSEKKSDKKADKGKGEKSAKSEKKSKKKESVRDVWNSNPDSSAGKINAVLMAKENKKKGLTIDEILEQLGDKDITRSRVRDHLRRIHLVDGFVEKDAKDRYKPTGKVFGKSEDAE